MLIHITFAVVYRFDITLNLLREACSDFFLTSGTTSLSIKYSPNQSSRTLGVFDRI